MIRVKLASVAHTQSADLFFIFHHSKYLTQSRGKESVLANADFELWQKKSWQILKLDSVVHTPSADLFFIFHHLKYLTQSRGKESVLANADFELWQKKSWQILMFQIV